MPINYTPEYSYYIGNVSSFNRLFHIIDVQDDTILVYSFNKINGIDSSYHVTSASNFFDQPLHDENLNLGYPPYCDGGAKPNVISYADIVSLDKFNYYENPNTPLDLTTLYLKPYMAYRFRADNFKLTEVDPNVSIIISVRPNLRYEYFNIDTVTKETYTSIMNFKPSNVLCINSGLGNLNTFKDYNILISPSVANFMCNLEFTPDLEKIENGSYLFSNRPKLKVIGPTTANSGQILDFTVSLMNETFTDTFVNPPSIEVWPVSDAGVLLHRKILLVNGQGSFKLDTSNLSSGDTFDVKVGWKYLTGDSKVTVTIS